MSVSKNKEWVTVQASCSATDWISFRMYIILCVCVYVINPRITAAYICTDDRKRKENWRVCTNIWPCKAFASSGESSSPYAVVTIWLMLTRLTDFQYWRLVKTQKNIEPVIQIKPCFCALLLVGHRIFFAKHMLTGLISCKNRAFWHIFHMQG